MKNTIIKLTVLSFGITFSNAQNFVSSTGQVVSSKLNSLLDGDVTNLTVTSGDAISTEGMQIFKENNVTLTSNYTTDSGQILSAGTTYTSYLLIADAGGPLTRFSGSITFVEEVEGLDFLTTTLQGSGSDIWKVAGVQYSAVPNIGFEFPVQDQISLESTTTNFSVLISEPGDRGRIFLETVIPEPSSAALLGLGFIGLVTRRKRA